MASLRFLWSHCALFLSLFYLVTSALKNAWESHLFMRPHKLHSRSMTKTIKFNVIHVSYKQKKLLEYVGEFVDEEIYAKLFSFHENSFV